MWSRLIIFALVLFLSTGCELVDSFNQGVNESLKESGLELDTETGKVTWSAKDNDNEVIEDDTKKNDLPENWPSNITLYPGAEVISTLTQTQNGETSIFIDFVSNDEAETIRDFYKGVLTAAGFEITEIYSENEIYAFEARQNDTRFNVTAEKRADDKTAVSLTLTNPS